MRMLARRDPLSERVHLTAVRCWRRLGIVAVARGLTPARRARLSPTVKAPARVKAACRHHRSNPGQPPQSAPRAARFTPRCESCRAAQREAMFEIYAFCRAVDDVADDRRPRAERLAESCSAGARISMRSMPAQPPPRLAACRAVRDIRARARKTSWPSSTAWKWMS